MKRIEIIVSRDALAVAWAVAVLLALLLPAASALAAGDANTSVCPAST
jgi:hypothetical protein